MSKQRRTGPGTARYDALYKEYKKLAKKADERMRGLEALRHKKGYEAVTKYAYRVAAKNIKKYGGEDRINRPRWNRGTPETYRQLQAKVSDIKQFLEAPSSTRRGIDRTYKARADAINKKYGKYGIHVNWTEIEDIFESATYQTLAAEYGSDQAVMILGTLQRHDVVKGDVEAILKEGAKYFKGTDDIVANLTIDALERNLITWADLV